MTKKETKPYWQKLLDPRWQRKRLEILERADFKCEACEAAEKTLHVHHCYYTGDEPWVQGPGDQHMLKVLCEDCHEERQAIEQGVKLEFARLLAQLGVIQLYDVVGDLLAIQDGVANGLSVLASDELEMLSDGRWFHAARSVPALRGIYERVTGTVAQWPQDDYSI